MYTCILIYLYAVCGYVCADLYVYAIACVGVCVELCVTSCDPIMCELTSTTQLYDTAMFNGYTCRDGNSNKHFYYKLAALHINASTPDDCRR